MIGNLNLIFSAWKFEKNEREIIGMNMDLFCATKTQMQK